RSDRRTPEVKQAQFSVREAQLVTFFEQRDAERSEASVSVDEPAVPWVSRGVWRRWFLVRWDPEGWDPEGPPLGLPADHRTAADHATPVPQSEFDNAPTAEIVGDWAPRRAADWAPAPKPSEKPLDELEADITKATPSPFPFTAMSWPVCHSRLAVMVWEGNVGLPPDGIGLPMGVPAQVEALVKAAQGAEPWDLRLGWDGNAVFQCSECGRLYWRGYEA
ncbi:MAG: hypothetical protein KDA24_17180, partial [Deltaproteobacteria bacterium]|nr:hypothetical protein [Deltaproteobacteria bacterium]